MPTIKTIATWNRQNHINYNVPQGFVLFKIDTAKLEGLRADFKLLSDFQDNKGIVADLEINIAYGDEKKSYKQIKTMWYLYKIMADIMNGGSIGKGAITPTQLYEDDLREHAPVDTVLASSAMVQSYRAEFRVIEEFNIDGKDATGLKVMVSASHWTKEYMAKWIDMLFNRIAELGIDAQEMGTIIHAWQEWRMALNRSKILLHNDKPITGVEYKRLNPICEATGQYLGNGGGSLAHIKARGMGGNPESHKDLPANWLHLSDSAHMEFDNVAGRIAFLKKYPHLRYKIETALGKDIPCCEKNINNITNVFEGEEQ